MMRSMFAGISGLRSHQTMMDVVGNNIANVNTAGYKASMVTFQETLSQQLRSASGASGDRGGINPLQIGLGTRVASVDGVFTQGASQMTGRATDLAVQGEGFFVVSSGDERFYTRAGAFSFDEIGNLVSPNGFSVMGWQADPTGEVDTSLPIGTIQLPLSQLIDPEPTATVEIGGNLSANAAVADTFNTSITIYDSLGQAHELVVSFEKTGDNAWNIAAEIDGSAATVGTPAVTFNTDGSLSSGGTIAISGVTPAGADPLSFDLLLDGSSPIAQFGGSSSPEAWNKDGNSIGFLQDFGISDDGSIVGSFSNGWTKVLGRIATATFNNAQGLQRAGDSNFMASVNSGEPLIGEPGSGNRGLLSAGTLEMSNVDLAQEFTNLIVAQRGFQANSRIITASDEILADLVNMKR